MYPKIGRRTELLSQILQKEPVDLMMVIRNYPAYIVSSYSEFIRSRGYMKFEEFYDRVYGQIAPNWLTISDQIKQAYPAANLMIFKHSDLVKRPKDVLSKMTGLDIPELVIPKQLYARPSMSGVGLDVLKLMDEYGIDQSDGNFVNALAKLLPKSKSFGPLEVLSEDQLEQLKSKYHHDLKDLNDKGYLIELSS